VTQRAGDMWDIWLPSSLAYGDEGRGVMIGVCACVCVCVLMLASRGDRPWRFSALYAAAYENKMNCLSHTLCCVHGRRKVNEAVRLKLIATPHLHKKIGAFRCARTAWCTRWNMLGMSRTQSRTRSGWVIRSLIVVLHVAREHPSESACHLGHFVTDRVFRSRAISASNDMLWPLRGLQ
jgi:hypothetical protein